MAATDTLPSALWERLRKSLFRPVSGLDRIALCLTWKKAVEGDQFLFLEFELLVLVFVKENPDKTFHVTKHELI